MESIIYKTLESRVHEPIVLAYTLLLLILLAKHRAFHVVLSKHLSKLTDRLTGLREIESLKRDSRD